MTFGMVFLACLLASLTASCVLALVFMLGPKLLLRIYRPMIDAHENDLTPPDIDDDIANVIESSEAELGRRTIMLIDAMEPEDVRKLHAVFTPQQRELVTQIVNLAAQIDESRPRTPPLEAVPYERQ